MNNLNGTHFLCELIRELSNDRNATHYKGEATITAIVHGEEVISSDTIDCEMVIKYDSVDINFYWEDCGYKDYKKMGLYGQASSKFQNITKLSNTSFKLSDPKGAYEFTIAW